jgi:hypothetical protein
MMNDERGMTLANSTQGQVNAEGDVLFQVKESDREDRRGFNILERSYRRTQTAPVWTRDTRG